MPTVTELIYKTTKDMTKEEVIDLLILESGENKKLAEEVKEFKERDEDEWAINHVYEHTDKYEDWIKGSTLYLELAEKNKQLKEKTAEHLGMAETLHDAVVEENKKLKDFHTFIKDSQQSHANELAKERDLYEGQRDEAIEEVKSLKDQMEDMYDEQGARDCCEDLGLVHEEDHEELQKDHEELKKAHEELQKAYKETKIELHKLTQKEIGVEEWKSRVEYHADQIVQMCQ